MRPPPRTGTDLTVEIVEPARGASRTGSVLEVSDLTVSFPSEAGHVDAVRGLSYAVTRGEVLGIVGESGSGKSVSSMAVMGLLPRSARISGSVRFKGEELLGNSDKEWTRIRGHGIAMVFQDPLSALTPVYTVGDQIGEAITIHQNVNRNVARNRAVELLDLVGIPNASERARSFPHEFSGGMRQRVMIAMAIANDPDLIIADEPTTALDVTIQAQILEGLRTAREVTGAAIIMITHDLSVIAGFADRVAVMYAGRIVEQGPVEDVFYAPKMPYTMGLLGAIPRIDSSGKEPLVPIEGTPPSLVDLPDACPFVPRCPLAIDVCRAREPALAPVGRSAQLAACHRSEEIATKGLKPTDVFPLPEVPPEPLARVPRAERRVVLEADGLVKHHALTK